MLGRGFAFDPANLHRLEAVPRDKGLVAQLAQDQHHQLAVYRIVLHQHQHAAPLIGKVMKGIFAPSKKDDQKTNEEEPASDESN